MATKLGTNATRIAGSAGIAGLAEQAEQTGRVHTIYDEYDLATAGLVITNGDVIKMGGLIPAGARIVNAFIDSADLDAQAAGAFTVGWQASDSLFNGTAEAANLTGFFNTVDVHTGAVATMLNTATKGAAAAASEGKFKKFTAPVQAVIKVTGTGDAVTGKICLCIQYIFD